MKRYVQAEKKARDDHVSRCCFFFTLNSEVIPIAEANVKGRHSMSDKCLDDGSQLILTVRFPVSS